MDFLDMCYEKVEAGVQKGLEAFVDKLYRADEKYYLSGKWKQNCYAPSLHTRTITTALGDITIQRRYYRYKKQRGGFFYIDAHFRLQPRIRVAEDIQLKIIELYGEMPVKMIAKQFGISRQTVYNILKRHGQFEKQQQVGEVSDQTIIYIQADEDHVSTQRKRIDKKKQVNEIRIVCVYEGVKEECAGRRQLVGKRYFLSTNLEPSLRFWERVDEYIRKKYPKAQRRYLGADGGGWIQGAMVVMPKVVFVYDHYHFKMHINRAFISSDERLQAARNAVIANDGLGFMQLYQDELDETPERAHIIKPHIRLIIRHWEAIRRNFTNKQYYGTSAESHVSHYCSQYFSSRPKAYANRNITAYIRLIESRLNHIPAHIYTKLANITSAQPIWFQEKDDERPVEVQNWKSSGNLPILTVGNSNTRDQLKGIRSISNSFIYSSGGYSGW